MNPHSDPLLKALLLVLTLAFPKSATTQTESSARWAIIGVADDFSNWLDTTTILTRGTSRFAWTESQFYSPQIVPDGPYNRLAIVAS